MDSFEPGPSPSSESSDATQITNKLETDAAKSYSTGLTLHELQRGKITAGIDTFQQELIVQKQQERMQQLPLEKETAIKAIEEDADTLPVTPATDIYKGYITTVLMSAREANDQKAWNSSVWEAGLALVAAKLNCGKLDNAEPITNETGETVGWYVGNNYEGENWDKKTYAEMAIKNNAIGVELARKSRVPESIQKMIRQLHPAWFREEFGIDFTQERIDFILQPRFAVVPFDRNRQTPQMFFTHGLMHYPPEAEFTRPQFDYLKANQFPPTIFYSGIEGAEGEKNDHERYMYNRRAKETGMTVEESIQETGSHEETHLLAIDPAIRLASTNSVESNNWLAEGVATYFGNNHHVQLQYLSEVKAIPLDLEKIVQPDNPRDRYYLGLLLTMALGRKLGKNGNLDLGVEKVIEQVVEKALEVNEKKSEALTSPLELLYCIDPSLETKEGRTEIISIMQEIKDNPELYARRDTKQTG